MGYERPEDCPPFKPPSDEWDVKPARLHNCGQCRHFAELPDLGSPLWTAKYRKSRGVCEANVTVDVLNEDSVILCCRFAAK